MDDTPVTRNIKLTAIRQFEASVPSCVARVTAGLVNCNVRIVSKNQLNESKQYLGEKGANLNEREAAFYYQQQGYEVVRFEHFASSAMGGLDAYSIKVSELLKRDVRKLLSKIQYERLIKRTDRFNETVDVSLNTVMPKDYPLNFYPPDFLVVRRHLLKPNEFKFVEVKGPTDHIHFRQANWAINLKPSDWKFEIFASVRGDMEETFVECDLPTATDAFLKAYKQKHDEVLDFRAMMKRNEKIRAEKKALEASRPKSITVEDSIATLQRRLGELIEDGERGRAALKDMPKRVKQ